LGIEAIVCPPASCHRPKSSQQTNGFQRGVGAGSVIGCASAASRFAAAQTGIQRLNYDASSDSLAVSLLIAARMEWRGAIPRPNIAARADA
jgi:hypothetical protein